MASTGYPNKQVKKSKTKKKTVKKTTKKAKSKPEPVAELIGDVPPVKPKATKPEPLMTTCPQCQKKIPVAELRTCQSCNRTWCINCGSANTDCPSCGKPVIRGT